MVDRVHITAEYIRQIMHYDPETGIFTWKIQKGKRVKPGDRTGCPDNLGYLLIRIDRNIYKAHRLAWLYMTGEWPDRMDHINCIRSDNRWCNLRCATHSQNIANRRSYNKSGFKGITKLNGKWQSRIMVNSKSIFLGCYETPEKAHSAYCEAALKYFGEFARAE